MYIFMHLLVLSVTVTVADGSVPVTAESSELRVREKVSGFSTTLSVEVIITSV